MRRLAHLHGPVPRMRSRKNLKGRTSYRHCMDEPSLYIDFLAFSATQKPVGPLEQRIISFLESEPSSESLDSPTFANINGSQSKADYLLGGSCIVAELKTIDGDPTDRITRRLKERFAQPGAPLVYGTVGFSRVIEALPDKSMFSKIVADVMTRAVRRHLQKANQQIGAIKARLGLPHAGGLVILMNDSEPMIDAGMIGYSLKAALETVPEAYPHITNVWASIESHRVRMPGGRVGYPQIHLYKSFERQAELQYIAQMLPAWARVNGSKIERLAHRGDWDFLLPIFDGPTPRVSPFS